MSWWKSLFRKCADDEQFDSELRFHIEELTEANIAAGLSAKEARRRAILEFGGREQIKEELRDVHRISLVESAVWNLKSAARFIRKSPSFSIAVILTLAIGIGANSAVFSAIDAVLLKPLPFPNGDELMRLEQYTPKVKSPQTFVAPLRLEDWNRMNSTFQALTGYYVENESETTGALPEKVMRAWVAPRFLQVWGISPALGRDFSPEEETFGGPTAVLISDRLWRHRFGGDSSVIGKQLRLEGSSWTVIGVLPASFRFPVRNADLWSPSPVNSPYSQDRGSTWYTVIGRLKAGVTVEEAQANLTTVQVQLGKTFPKTDAELAVRIKPLKDATVGGVSSSLWVLFGSVSLLLLIACTNIAALFLARAIQRKHEVSVRFSLGATRAAVMTQLLTEAFVLAVLGAGLGLIVAAGASQVFRSLAGDLPRVDEIQLDWKIVLYSLACSIVATILCGLFPAIQATRRDISGSLAQKGRGQVSGNHPAQWTLVGVQVALAVTLLMGAGLLLRSFQELGRVSPGFEMSHVLTFRISANWGETGDMKGLTQRIDRSIEALRNVPGVEAAATAAALPGVPQQYQTELKVAEGEVDPSHKVLAESRWVSTGYFETMKIPLIAGELCRSQADHSTVELLVNRSFANAYFAGTAPIGKHLSLVGNTFQLAPGKIVAVVGDARESGINREPGPTVYWCSSAPTPDPFYLVRTAMAPIAMAETMRQKVHEIEPGRSVFDLMPLQEHLDEAFAENRLRMVLLTFFAATAVLLACIGLYGTLSYSVNTRRREVGLRLALGALGGQIVKQFLLQGLGVSLVGCVAGCGLAMAFARVLAEMLYGVSPSDVPTLSGVIVMVLLVAAAASLVPAMRAARVEPMEVLRDE
jgi:putative ABC transport system permease protein